MIKLDNTLWQIATSRCAALALTSLLGAGVVSVGCAEDDDDRNTAEDRDPSTPDEEDGSTRMDASADASDSQDAGTDGESPQDASADASNGEDGGTDGGPDSAPIPQNESAILEVLMTIDRGEISQAQLAEKRATDDDVREYASSMMREHREALEELEELVEDEELRPKPSALSNELREQALTTREMLRGIPRGRRFDRQYMKSQVEMHARALEVVTAMSAYVTSDELEDELEDHREAIVEHLEEARELLRSSGEDDGDEG